MRYFVPTSIALLLTALVQPAGAQEPSATQLTFDEAGDGEPAWSPDGTQIAFTSSRSGNADIWVMPATGEPPSTQLTFDPAEDLRPVWSPDGSQIAFESHRSGNLDIWVMPASGEPATQLTFDPADDLNPVWSPDGSQIAFESGNIWVVPASGGQPTQLTFSPWGDFDPDWSPDGTQIVLGIVAGCEPCTSHLFLMPVTGGKPTQLTTEGGECYRDPDWSPDGSEIAFARRYCGLIGGPRRPSYVCVVSASGGPATAITLPQDVIGDGEPAWSPDGTQIAFTSNRSGNSDIWVMPRIVPVEPTTWGAIKAQYHE